MLGVSGRKPQSKSNAQRVLDKYGIPYQTYLYDPSIKTANGAAEALGVPPEMVYKTLVMLPDEGRPMLVMTAAGTEVDLRSLARTIGQKSVKMAPRTEAEKLTGLQTGGIGALALLGKAFDVFIDRRALESDLILVNGGRRGLNIGLRPDDLVQVTGARPLDVH